MNRTDSPRADTPQPSESDTGAASRVKIEDDYRWSGVTPEPYKVGVDNFHGAVRQVLVGEDAGEQAPGFVTRYFELEPGGYTSLERHAHPHVVVILRGRAEIILDTRVEVATPHDAVYIAPWCLHQLHSVPDDHAPDEPLGFLCIVDRERDRPVYPELEEVERLRQKPSVAARLRT